MRPVLDPNDRRCYKPAPMLTYNLKDKVVAITGASAGIGAAAARAFAAEGARVAISARSKDKIEALAAELRQGGAQVYAATMDVTSELEVTRYFEGLFAEWGYCDVLVNNAGVGMFAPIAELSVELFDRAMQVNVYGALRCTRAVLPVMRARSRGQIINISSSAGKRALPYMGGYCATKFALNALTESLRVEVASEGIDVILVCPGLTATDFKGNVISSRKEIPEMPAALGGQSADEVAEAIVRASRRRAREVVLTASGKALVAANQLIPWAVDKALGEISRRVVAK
jgi:short-subunit dehydrogenase